MKRTMSFKRLILTFCSIVLMFSVLVVSTFSALTNSKVAVGRITFDDQYKLIVALTDNASSSISSSDITISKQYFSGSALANIKLTATSNTATSLNNGSITGNFKQYSWALNGVNFATQDLEFSVYALKTYSYYPQMKITLQYTGTGFEDVHLAFNTSQDKVFSMGDSTGKYYSYFVRANGQNYIVTYPKESQPSNGVIKREISCIPLGADNKPLKVTGTGISNLNYNISVKDILNGIYFESDYSGTPTMQVKFSLDKELVL